MELLTPYAIALGAIAAWCVLWIAGNWAIARLSGWADLARHYSQLGSFTGRRFLFQSGILRYPLFAFRGTLIVAVNRQGVQLRVLPPFAFGHKALFIPWQDIRFLPREERTLMAHPELEFARCPSVRLVASRRLAQMLVESAEGPVPLEGAI